MTTTRSPKTDRDGNAVDTIPPLARLFPLGLQHVLAMYAGAVAVPLIVGGAFGFEGADLAYLISADLLVAGLATILQSVGFWRFGVRLPIMQGVTFAAVGPMVAIGQSYPITAVFGATIVCGLFMILIAPFFAQLLRFFPPIVTGSVILIIGLSLMSVAAGWIVTGSDDGSGSGLSLAFAGGTLLLIILIERFAPRGLARVSVLLGLVIGTAVAAFVPGMTDWSGVGEAAWFGLVTPFHFGLPTFEIVPIVSMLIVGIVIMTETTGDMIAVGEIVDKPVTRRQVADGLRADGLGTVIGGVFNTFPYTAFAQNVGLVSLTGVRSRFVATAAGAILVVLGLLPKVSALVEGVPRAVLGGAGIALFGMVAASGIRTLAKVKLDNRNILRRGAPHRGAVGAARAGLADRGGDRARAARAPRGRARRHVDDHGAAARRARRDLREARRAALRRRDRDARRQRLRGGRVGARRRDGRPAEVPRRAERILAHHAVGARGRRRPVPRARRGGDPRDGRRGERRLRGIELLRPRHECGLRGPAAAQPPQGGEGRALRRARVRGRAARGGARHRLRPPRGRRPRDAGWRRGARPHRLRRPGAQDDERHRGRDPGRRARRRRARGAARRLLDRDRHLLRPPARPRLAHRHDGLQRAQGRRAHDARGPRAGAAPPYRRPRGRRRS